MKKYCALFMTGAVAVSLITGCGSGPAKEHSRQANYPQNYKDGTYTAQSGPDERGSVGEITLTVQGGKIVKADYKGIQKDGKVKDADYGKTNGKIENQEFYKKAQHAVKAAATYAPKLVETQSVDKVDAVSGATVSYKQFVEAEQKALEQAK
jgi:major membrane immunogen (membrane-anchored lipoprotein)